MPDEVEVTVDGRAIRVPRGATVAVALMRAGGAARRSVTGELRGPLCGMGICQECRVTIDGHVHQRACLCLAADGQIVETGTRT